MSEHEHRRRLGTALVTLGGLALVVAVVVALLLPGSATHHPRTTATSTTPVGSSTPSATTTSSTAPTTTTPSVSSTTTPAPPAPAPARPPPRTEQFGASVNLLFNGATNPPQLIATQLAALRATGVTIARSDALWEATEPAAPTAGVHTYDWAFDDRIAGDLAAHRLRWLPILDYSAPWAASVPGQDHSAPSSSAAYAAYAGAFAARYGSAGTYWRAHPGVRAEPVQTYEIWNEPDNGEFWAPRPDPARYADLYASARAAIDAVDPGARVIVGGLTNPRGFLPAILAAQPALRNHVDGVAIHPYGTPAVVLGQIKADRAALIQLGMADVPLYATEFGWTTTPPGALDYVPASLRPTYIFETVAALGHLDCGLAATVLYTWYSPQQDPADSQKWYGIDSLSGAPTADTAAMTRGLRRATGPAGTFPLCG